MSHFFPPFLIHNLTPKGILFFQALIWPSISPSSGNFIFYKLRELWWVDNDNHEGENSIRALVSFLKLCPALEQLYVMVCSILGCNWCSCFAI